MEETSQQVFFNGWRRRTTLKLRLEQLPVSVAVVQTNTAELIDSVQTMGLIENCLNVCL